MNKIWMILAAITAAAAGIITFIVKNAAKTDKPEAEMQAS